MSYRTIKRVFDIAFSGAVIAVGLVPGVLLGAAVAIDTKGSPIFVQERIGHKGPFPCLKYRTMYAWATEEEHLTPEQLEHWIRERKVPNDPRITRLGRFLRSTSIDEFPQFINVLLGQMSVVGPRAVIAEELEKYFTEEQRKLYLSVPSGITGVWQVGPRNAATWTSGERVAIELDYVKNASLRLDAEVIAKTFGEILFRHSGL